MASIRYGTVTLQMVQTEHWVYEPVMSEDTQDYLYTHVLWSGTCTWSEAATASNITQFGPGVIGEARGDRLGVSLVNLSQYLQQPRRQLRIDLGQDRVIFSPDTDTNPNATCDANGGPHVRNLRLTRITGDKLALVSFTVETWVNNSTNIVLANRYTVSAIVNEDAYTTRIVNGRATLRLDLLNAPGFGGGTPDDFRKNFFLEVPLGFQRERVSVQVTPDGSELAYQVHDREVALELGFDSPVTRLRGYVTCGSDSPIRDARAMMTALRAVADAGSSIFSIHTLLHPVDTLMNVAQPIINALPSVKANAIIQCWGRKDTNKQDMANLAIAAALDRLSPIGGALGFGLIPDKPLIVSAYCTQALHERYVEVRIEVFVGIGAISKATFQPTAFKKFMNLDNTITLAGSGRTLTGDGSKGGPTLPNSSGTRGTWTGALLAQALGSDGNLPKVPASSDVIDRDLE